MPLGRGLNSLLPSKPITTKFSHEEINKIDEKNQVLQVALDKIQLNPHQPRKRFDHAELEDLNAQAANLAIKISEYFKKLEI